MYGTAMAMLLLRSLVDGYLIGSEVDVCMVLLWLCFITQIPGGWLSDRFGGRRVYGTAMAMLLLRSLVDGYLIGSEVDVCMVLLWLCYYSDPWWMVI